MLSIIIPANNEENYLPACLDALLAQTRPDGRAMPEVVIAANACTDRTVEIGQSRAAAFQGKGWGFQILDIAEGGKPNALNQADLAARGMWRLYLDADVVCAPGLIAEIERLLDAPGAVYASGTLVVAEAQSWVTRRYGALWSNLPFMKTGVQGAGLFAVNAEGRKRWGAFPRIIADDAYIRLLFRPEERVKTEVPYLWPMVEGFSNLVRVRLRQDQGVRELARKFPEILKNESKPPLQLVDHLRLAGSMPKSYAVYVTVSLAVRLKGLLDQGDQPWRRGR